ncbi:uncharacterized protein PODANS_5_7580 [Podospora anserina S mat+]|uniref:Podospora anserina S mat+ genomic DNA chromosome 5, supercontig 8 n=1 Tax=Podospora anserina (strain S / ATCC MYA-4624 / DSM 980 / FGSC 10383) TaxID=515849 RepID=B2AMD1_PODAN|nr:uncharacterized protein PODANS_5_7580 [Podospora anserina S mat+]CAP65191.1 unnamed protein product [Podospora anserina S mat+]CDP29719.1 Putative protein of unknown function [Podospora anserina S mat+]
MKSVTRLLEPALHSLVGGSTHHLLKHLLSIVSLHSIASTRSLHELDKSSFPLPLLGQKLAAIRASLHDDLGIAVLRGLDPSIWSMRETFVAFAGLSSHVSRERGRQAGNKMIGILDSRTPLPHLNHQR